MFTAQDKISCHLCIAIKKISILIRLNNLTSSLLLMVMPPKTDYRMSSTSQLYCQIPTLSLLRNWSLAVLQFRSNPDQMHLLLVCCVVTEDNIHFFQALALGFGDNEEYEQQGHQTPGREEDVCAKAKGPQHTRGDKANDEIAHPRRARCNGDGLRSVAQVEDLRRQDPANRSKRVGEVDVVDVDESDTGPASCFVGDQRRSVAANDAADDDQRYHGSHCSRHE